MEVPPESRASSADLVRADLIAPLFLGAIQRRIRGLKQHFSQVVVRGRRLVERSAGDADADRNCALGIVHTGEDGRCAAHRATQVTGNLSGVERRTAGYLNNDPAAA